LLGDYHQFESNRRRAFSSQSYHQREVATVRLDTFAHQRGLRPDLVKIDIEGAECAALEGATRLLVEQTPIILVEVTRRGEEVFRLLTGAGYLLFTPEGQPLRDAESLHDNVCAVHPIAHKDRLSHWIESHRRAAA
jgi:hypothetical protein